VKFVVTVVLVEDVKQLIFLHWVEMLFYASGS
jgi:hypothetical protein